MRQNLRILGTVALAAAVSASHAWSAESADPIKLTLHDWSGQLINTKIMGSILEEAGYNVEYVQADYIAQFAGLKTGDLHLAMEIWETTGREALDDATASGKVVNAGETGLMAIEEWWYPAYMKDRCPGLPDWQALKDCAEEFATAETSPYGRYVGGPVTWGGFDEERIEALELEFEVVHAGTDAALFAELESAYQRQDPIVLWVYVPHWAPAKYEGEFVEFPPYSAECYADPAAGVNPDMAYDCGKPRGPIWKAAWAGLPEKWPGAYEIIQSYRVSNEEMSAMVGKADLEGVDIDTVVSGWMTANKDRWSGWISN
ncbi:ABC transporter substrate-binding protein [Leisingera thetidis]|uniref:ABC transporter substrate-binding protein n=1 Tax=Leisingera thetidis TaxID=2930199 RepID=UPI0021F7EC07|nr:ABC transporter substrate-binding protein [Leisingera thetidis]